MLAFSSLQPSPPVLQVLAAPLLAMSEDTRPLWQLIVETLPPFDAETEWLMLHDIAPLLNLTRHALAKHCRDLWPDHEGHWRLNRGQAVALIRRVVYAGRKLPTRAQVLARLKERTEQGHL